MRKLLSVWILLAVQSSVCHALQLNFAYSEFAEFAFDLYYNAIIENQDPAFRDDLADWGTQEPGLLEKMSADQELLFPRNPYITEDSFFCKLAQLNAIEALEQVLSAIGDLAQRERLREKG